MNTKLECKSIEAALPDLLFDPPAAPPEAHAHLATCATCQTELKAMAQTMNMLDAWEAPEPSPYWNARMGALLREEQAKPQRGWAGFRERLRTRLWLGNHKPVLAGAAAFAVLLAAGGGAWLELSPSGTGKSAPVTEASNTVRDLQSINENAQVFQQMSALDAPDADGPNTD